MLEYHKASRYTLYSLFLANVTVMERKVLMLELSQFTPMVLSALQKVIPGLEGNEALQNAVGDMAPKVLELLQQPDAKSVLEQLAGNANDPELRNQLMGHIQSVAKDNGHLVESLMEKSGLSALSGIAGMASGLFK
jgi:hypothetical protein